MRQYFPVPLPLSQAPSLGPFHSVTVFIFSSFVTYLPISKLYDYCISFIRQFLEIILFVFTHLCLSHRLRFFPCLKGSIIYPQDLLCIWCLLSLPSPAPVWMLWSSFLAIHPQASTSLLPWVRSTLPGFPVFLGYLITLLESILQ